MIRFSLEPIRAICEKLNNPQDRLCFIHIAGTNGKGSVSAFLSSILKEAHLTVGTYTSPAVFSEREIICVNGRPIAQKAYKEGMERIDAICKELAVGASEFERQTALAFLFFAEKKCDLIVLEAGMGGALDATNLVRNTVVSVFTPISSDHTDYLGRSLHNIASNKAGILKPRCVAVSAPQEKEAEAVLSERADALEVPLLLLKKEMLSYRLSKRIGEQKFNLNLIKYREQGLISDDFPDVLEKLSISLAGEHQIVNAATAVIAALMAYTKLSVEQPAEAGAEQGRAALFSDASRFEQAIRKGLHNAKNPGRFELLKTRGSAAGVSGAGRGAKIDVLLDGAHNIGGAKALAASLRQYYGGRRLLGIVGMLKDKEHGAVLSELAPCFAQLFTVTTFGERGFGAAELAGIAAGFLPNVTSVGGIEEALELALLSAGKEDAIVVFGSLSILKGAKDYLKELEKK